MDVYRRLINRDLPWEERSCTSKVPHEQRAEARATARRRRGDGSLRPYHCRLGDHWHLGHRRRRHAEAGDRPLARPARTLADSRLDWLSRDWWADRRRRHLRPPPADHSWRDAWAAT